VRLSVAASILSASTHRLIQDAHPMLVDPVLEVVLCEADEVANLHEGDASL
jgi:hypothetical protein